MVSGTGFLAGATVTVDVVAVSVTVVNSTTITAIVPADAAGHADVVVTNPSGSRGTLTAAFTYSFDEPFTLTPSTNVVDSGGQMSVSWTAPGGRRATGLPWSGWEEPTTTTGMVLRMGATSGALTVTAPTRVGQYEFRYLLDGGFLEAARSSQVTVR